MGTPGTIWMASMAQVSHGTATTTTARAAAELCRTTTPLRCCTARVMKMTSVVLSATATASEPIAGTAPMDPARTLMASSSSLQSCSGSNGRARTAKNPISRSFRMPSSPNATPTNVAATDVALLGRTSSSATQRSPSSGTLTNAPGVRRLNSSGVSKARRTSRQANKVETRAAMGCHLARSTSPAPCGAW